MKSGRTNLALATILVLCFAVLAQAEHPAKVHFIDVGQAESILLEFDQEVVLIDAGGEDSTDAAQNKHLIQYLTNFFKKRPELNNTIDTIIVSHPHKDHTKMLPAVMQAFTVNNLVDGGADHGSGIAALKKARLAIKQKHGHYFVVTAKDTLKPSFSLAPFDAIQAKESDVHFKLIGGTRGCKDQNSDSIVVLLKYKESRFIFTGDASDKTDPLCKPSEIPDLLDHYGSTGDLRADVFKADHHASKNGVNEDWIRAVAPQISVISAGLHDKKHRAPGKFHAWQFGHPTEAAVSLMEQFTSKNRTSIMVSTGNGAMSFRRKRALTKGRLLHLLGWRYFDRRSYSESNDRSLTSLSRRYDLRAPDGDTRPL
jgi:competence protein ComEC